MDNSFYRHLLGKIKKSGALPHHNIPSHNLLSVEALLEGSENLNVETIDQDPEFLASFPCYGKFPYVVSRNLPLLCGSGYTDNARQLVNEKSKWQKHLRNLKFDNINKAAKDVKALRKNKNVKISENLRKHLNHFRVDPEPMFYGNYNWLYTGGTVDYMQENDEVTLIAADSFRKKPGFNILRLDESCQEVQFKASSNLKAFSPVLQITCRSSGENSLLCVRQKNFLNLFSTKEAVSSNCLSQPVKLWRKKVPSPKLMICADIKHDCEEIVLSDSNQDIHGFHMDRKFKIYGCSGRKILPDSQRDAWSQVSFGDHGLDVAFRNCFVVLDPRMGRSSGAAFQYTPFKFVNYCEDICSFVKSSNDSNYMYLGTTHSLLQLDLRNGETVQKWTHLMKKPPQFLTNTKDGEGNEVLVLQSPEVDEVTGIVNGRGNQGEKFNFLSTSLPFLLKNVKESLRTARFHGVCLSPLIAERINFNVTGMKCLKTSSGCLNIFTKNSAGDVFVTELRKRSGSRDEENEQETVEAMKHYESHLENFSLRKSLSSQLKKTDMRHVLEDLKSPRPRVKSRKRAEISWKYENMHSPENLELCRDLLAPRILNVWGYGSDLNELDGLTVSVNEKVHDWMSRN